jgi:hypothetical protein
MTFQYGKSFICDDIFHSLKWCRLCKPALQVRALQAGEEKQA